MIGDDDTPAANVEEYISRKPAFARPICELLRALIHKAAPTLDEGIRWGGPSYKGKGLVLGLGAFKEHVTLFFARGKELDDPEGVLDESEGTAASRNFKVKSLAEAKAKSKALTALIKQAVALDAQGPAAKKAKRPELPVPAVLSAALRSHAKARKTFEGFSPSARRDYCEWIGGAKKEETVQRRLEKALVMLSEGKSMSDAYK